MSLAAVSMLAENAAPFYGALSAYLGRRLGLELRLAAELPYAERWSWLEDGRASVAFICGLPYTRLAGQSAPPIELLAAPVMAEARYGGRPVYFSDVIVRAERPFRSLADLRGARLAFNEPESFSGYVTVQAQLAALGERGGFFGQAVRSGAHMESIRLVEAGEADAAAIDSIVLAYELAQRPGLAARLRSVAAIGPSPAPPLVASRALPAARRALLQEALLELHSHAEGRALLALGMLERFAPVQDADYDPIRRSAAAGAGIALTTQG